MHGEEGQKRTQRRGESREADAFGGYSGKGLTGGIKLCG